MPVTLNFGVGSMLTLDQILTKINIQSGKIHLILRGRNLSPDFLENLPLWNIETLDLSNCQLDDAAISCLMQRIMNQEEALPLQALILSNNTFGFEGAEALVEALPKLTKLQRLNLASNKLNEQAVCKIAESFEGRSLEHFDFSFLEISEEKTAIALSKLKVKCLELNGSRFPEDYLEMIRKAIQKRGGEFAATTVFSSEKSTEFLKYKANLKTINLSGYDNLTVCAKQQPQAPDISPNNESGNVFSSIAQNC